MDEWLNQYLFYFSRRVRPSTTARVEVLLRAFLRELGGQGLSESSSITRVHLETWRLRLVRRGLKPYTIEGYVSAVRGFLAWMYLSGYLLVNPYPDEWDDRRARGGIRSAPGERQARAMLERISERSLRPVRDRAILELAYASGLRRGELQALNLHDLRGDWLSVRGKGGSERVVPLGGKAKAWLRQYLGTERLSIVQRKNPHEEALFLTEEGKRLGLSSFSYLVSRHREKESRITLHSFRHACATHMLARGASIVVLQKLLGHQKLSTTQIYTQVEIKSIKRVLDQCHPRDRFSVPRPSTAAPSGSPSSNAPG